MPPLPPPVAALITLLLDNLQALLGPELVGIYLRGSLASGDFEPERSDIDLLVVTETALNEAQFTHLKAFHDQIAASDNAYARRIELAYIDRQSLRVYHPGQQHPTLGQGEELSWQVHGANWLLERWMLREEGRTLTGPNPKTLIDPIPAPGLKGAVASRVLDWAAWARDEADPDWQLPLSHKAYAIDTMCRILFTASKGALTSKADSVAWALDTLPEPWRDLVLRSRDWRLDQQVDLSVNPEIRNFIRWTANQVEELVQETESALEEPD